jgi:UDP-hydrolysing UDP-N-acetyl-D-glucosamine 2-epimerase
MKKRKIAIFTGNRAEYGLQLPILNAIKNHPLLDYRLIVSGAHLEENFGNTINEIKNDGFKITKEVDINFKDDTLFGTTQAISSCINLTSKVLNKIKPDIFVVYADRFEGFGALVAGSHLKIPTAHIEGGDITEGGALDDSVRHAMTKLAHIHFTTNSEASWRIRKMGEESWRVFTVGFPAIDLIKDKNFTEEKVLIDKYKLNINKPILLNTLHSIATQYENSRSQILSLIRASKILAKKGYQSIFTYPNNDAGGKEIIKELKLLKMKNIDNIKVYKSLGRKDYHGILNMCGKGAGIGVCVGNSSSGIKETPAFNIPAVDIGSRQNSRLAAKNVIKTNYEPSNIINAIEKALTENFRKKCKSIKNPYGIGRAGVKVANVLAKIKINNDLIVKKMTIKK